MKYELTNDLLTGNTQIDAQHRQLLDTVNHLMEACAKGKGRDHIHSTISFLSDYVVKHFQDEERLQLQSAYPGHAGHKQFHDSYRQQLAAHAQTLLQEGPTVKALGNLNQAVAVLITHIRTEDKRVAHHIQQQ